MESVIKWQTGEPEDWCTCIVTKKTGEVGLGVWIHSPKSKGWRTSNLLNKINDVLGWCPLSYIEPYKEEQK